MKDDSPALFSVIRLEQGVVSGREVASTRVWSLDAPSNSRYTKALAERKLPYDPLSFIRDCLRDGRILWTYHVNMRLGQRFIARETIIAAAEGYEIVEAYPDDKYLSSYLLLGRRGTDAFHALFGTDVDGQNVRVITAYYPSPDEWEEDLKTRRRFQ